MISLCPLNTYRVDSRDRFKFVRLFGTLLQITSVIFPFHKIFTKKDTFMLLFFSFLILSVVTAPFKDDENCLHFVQSSLILLEKVHEKKSPPTFFFSSEHSFENCIHFPPHCSSFECFKKLFLACFQLQTGSQELVCLLRGSDIFALQEVQLQHHQILQMLDWFSLFSLAFFSLKSKSLSRQA